MICASEFYIGKVEDDEFISIRPERKNCNHHRFNEGHRARAIAEAMAREGANVVISSRKADKCEEVAKAILYLASADARFVTGVAFPIDGAQTAG